jgi:DNA topoisomerase-1
LPQFLSDAKTFMPIASRRTPSPPAGLRYTADREAGITRRGGKAGFSYVDARGKRVTNPDTIERIRKLAIPPAWTDVWICADERGHLQATGRDTRGRKQYRYHARWRERRDADKFDHLVEFAEALPAIRARVEADLRQQGLKRTKVLAAIVRLMELTSMRVGNERYAEENDSFGLTTLRNRHVKVSKQRIEFQFRGKSGKFHRIGVEDPRLARIVARCRDLPGQDLFQYLDEAGEVQVIGSSDVNEYLKEAAGIDEVTTKDFRTWNGTVLAARFLAARDGPVGATHVVAAVRHASEHLGNTPAICRKSYVHPRVMDPEAWAGARVAARRRRGLRAEEAAVLALLSAASRKPRPRRPRRASTSASASPP